MGAPPSTGTEPVEQSGGPPRRPADPVGPVGPGGPGGPEGPEQPPQGRGGPSRRALLITAAGVVAAAGVGTAVALRSSPSGGTARPSASPSASASPTTSSPATDVAGIDGWASGASGDGAADGSLAAWRGAPLGVAATWSDDNSAMVSISQLDDGGEYADWTGPLDIAIGAIGQGETWQAAASGAYEDRWTRSLQTLRQRWGGREAQLYIRFAHEMNGNWYPWAVTSSAAKDFTAAWRRFRGLQQSIFGEAKLVFCVNRESSRGQADWRSTFPGADAVDVLAVDYYNQNPAVATVAQWDASMTATDTLGAPKGLEGHRRFAQDAGLPLAVPEWSGVADSGDDPVFIGQMHAFFHQHAGTGAGEVLYEALFNANNDNGKFQLFRDGTRMPASAARYRSLFGGAASS